MCYRIDGREKLVKGIKPQWIISFEGRHARSKYEYSGLRRWRRIHPEPAGEEKGGPSKINWAVQISWALALYLEAAVVESETYLKLKVQDARSLADENRSEICVQGLGHEVAFSDRLDSNQTYDAFSKLNWSDEHGCQAHEQIAKRGSWRQALWENSPTRVIPHRRIHRCQGIDRGVRRKVYGESSDAVFCEADRRW